MKTSDKLLLTLALLILGVFGAINLTLYARMKAGHIKNMYSRDGWVHPYEGKPPSKITPVATFQLVNETPSPIPPVTPIQP